MTTCATCQNWNLRGHVAMAKQGFAACANGPRYTYLAPTQTCNRHVPVPVDVQEKRVKWLKG